MNVLPLVSAFILLFAIGSYTFVHQFHAAYFEQKSYSGSMHLQRKYRNALEKIRYEDCPGKPPPSDKKEKEEKKDKEDKETPYHCPRDRKDLIPQSKLNITSLVKEENPHLKKVAINLINDLYQFTSLEVDGEDLVETLTNTLKKDPTINTFEKVLKVASEEEAPLLYKLIKGTTEYQLFTSKGIPPIGDFISLDTSTHAKPIHFAYASRIVLQAHFGDILAPQIINEEKHKWEVEKKHKPLKKDELEALLIQHRKNPPDYISLLSFSTDHDKEENIRLKDCENGVQLRFNP